MELAYMNLLIHPLKDSYFLVILDSSVSKAMGLRGQDVFTYMGPE